MAFTQTYQAFEPTIWSPRLNMFFKKKLHSKYIATDYSDEVAGGASAVYVGSISDGFAATAIVTTTGAVTPTNLSDTKSAITLNKWMASAFVITDYQKARVANSYRLQEKYIDGAAYSLAKKFDQNILSNISSGTFSVGNTATNIPSTTLEHAMAIAESQSMPLEECAFVFGPKAYWQEIGATAKYYDASIYGKATIPDGFINRLYGIPVLVSTNLPAAAGNGTTNALLHKSAIGYAIAGGGAKISIKNSENLRTKYIADILYGHTLLTAGRVIKILSNN